MRMRNAISGDGGRGRIIEVHIWSFNNLYRVLVLRKI